jgi:acyl carrier protein
VVATSAVVKPSNEQSFPAIGRPILNTWIHLIDESGCEVQDGEVGEIYIGGSGVALGYRNRPDLTKANFVSITIEGRTERTFRTGDLARRLSDGQFEFVGRTDDQIKIRGFRIEPEEIVYTINRHPSVVSSAVIARDESGEKRLTAYVVAHAGAEIWERDLRIFLGRSLPDYMLPANFVILDHIPITVNGKLDRTKLPSPTSQNQLRLDEYIAPRTELEQVVAGILAPILGLEKLSDHDNFFLLGGHSLMGAQVIVKVCDIFDVELDLRTLFQNATVSMLAAAIKASLTFKLEAMSEDEVNQALLEQALYDSSGGNRMAGAK